MVGLLLMMGRLLIGCFNDWSLTALMIGRILLLDSIGKKQANQLAGDD
jgi:hypothetical protein